MCIQCDINERREREYKKPYFYNPVDQIVNLVIERWIVMIKWPICLYYKSYKTTDGQNHI